MAITVLGAFRPFSHFCIEPFFGTATFVSKKGLLWCPGIYYGGWSKGMQVIVSGKIRAQRAKSMKFKDGYMISSGQPVKDKVTTVKAKAALALAAPTYRVWEPV